ncbi:porin family protein [Alcanivorax sp. DP30]|uniref:porin family protein n=1 Tax=Alcanivorax sp. DP30 TaxID=2606217 RepID=UPI00136E2B8A|nr:porin family protein [Alcanivorax sp. DP30]MZR61333.1 outer membrane beta-barrel protein [Alcanivorax sp. DP30]
MKVWMRGALVLSCSLVAGQEAWATGPYVGGSYSQIQYDNEEFDTDTLKIDAATVNAGFEVTDFLALEARGGVGLNEDSQGIADFELDHLYGGYVKLGAPISDTVRPYVIGGYTKAKGTVSADGEVAGVTYSFSDSENFEDESWGAGLDMNITDTLGANLEYMRYIDTDEEEISGISVGLRSAF